MEKKHVLFTMAFAAICASASAYAPAVSMSAKAPSAISGKAKVAPADVKNDRINHWELTNEVKPEANALDGQLLVIGSADGASVIAGCSVDSKRPSGSSWDLFTAKVADFDADYNVYAKFTKVTDAGVEGDNIYTINVCNEKGDIYAGASWAPYGFLNFQNNNGTVIFALGLGSEYGQDGKNLALWQVEAVEGGYNIKNVGRGEYLNPASSNPSADAVAVKLFSKVNHKEYEAYATDIEDGEKYLLKNVETGKFLAPGNSWSTQASLDDHGSFFTIDRLENGKYTLSSVVSNGGNSHYLNGSYCDAAATEFMIFSTEDGYVLTLNDQVEEPTYFGANANGKTCDLASKERNAATTWQLLTVEDILSDDAVNNADEANPLDLTVLLKDPNFGRNNTEGGWDIMPNKNGDNANFNAEKWGGNSELFDSHQTVKGLPNGRYMIMAQGYYRYNNTNTNTNDIAAATHANGTEVINSFLYANGQEVALKSIADEEAVATYGNMPFNQSEASAAFNMGLYDNVLYNVLVTDETLTLGVKKTSHPGCDWTVWDNFRIYYLGAEDPMRIEEIAVEKQEVTTDGEGNTVVEDGNAELVVEFATEAAVTGKANDIIVFGSAFLLDNGAEIPATNGYVRDAKGMSTGKEISSDIAQMNSFTIPVPVAGEGSFTAVLPRGFFVYLDADYDWSGTGGVHNAKAKDIARVIAKAAAKGKAGLVQEITVSFNVGANGATSIQGIQGITADGKVYDLSGRVTVNGKGIVIKNGKKVLVK